MNKNNLLKNVSNVNDSSSQVISARAGLEGKVKDISLKNVTKNSESVVKKSVEAAITKKFDLDTSENGEMHTAMNLSEDAVHKAYSVATAGYKFQKNIKREAAVYFLDKIIQDEASNDISFGTGIVSLNDIVESDSVNGKITVGEIVNSSDINLDNVIDADKPSDLTDFMSVSSSRSIENFTGLYDGPMTLPDNSTGFVSSTLDMNNVFDTSALIGLPGGSSDITDSLVLGSDDRTFVSVSVKDLVDKNKIKITNQNAGIKDINSKFAGAVFQTHGKQKSTVSPELKKTITKGLKKKMESSDKSKSSKGNGNTSAAFREARKAAINFMIKSDMQQDNNMSSGVSGFIKNGLSNFFMNKGKEIGKAVGKEAGKLMLYAVGYGLASIVLAFQFFLPLLIPMFAVGAIGGIGHKKVNDEKGAKTDEEIRLIIEENPDIFGKFSSDLSEAPLGTLELSYDELKKTFTWMSSDNVYPVKNQEKLVTSQYTLHRTDVEDHKVHYGVDFSAPMDSELVAIADATVEATNRAPSYGNHVILKFDDGTYCLYAHMSDFVLNKNGSDNSDNWTYLKVGDKVKAGDLIGHSGSSGDSTGPHLHMVLSTSPYGNENGSRYDFNAYVKEVWCPDFDFSYDYDQTYGIFDEDLEDLKDDEDDE